MHPGRDIDIGAHRRVEYLNASQDVSRTELRRSTGTGYPLKTEVVVVVLIPAEEIGIPCLWHSPHGRALPPEVYRPILLGESEVIAGIDLKIRSTTIAIQGALTKFLFVPGMLRGTDCGKSLYRAAVAVVDERLSPVVALGMQHEHARIAVSACDQ